MYILLFNRTFAPEDVSAKGNVVYVHIEVLCAVCIGIYISAQTQPQGHVAFVSPGSTGTTMLWNKSEGKLGAVWIFYVCQGLSSGGAPALRDLGFF